MGRRRRTRRVEPAVYDFVATLVREKGYTNAAAIYRLAEQKFPDLCPSERTIRNLVAELLPPDPSGPWVPDPTGWDGESARRVLQAWADRFPDDGPSAWQPPSAEQARWLRWVLEGWPDLPGAVAARLADELRARHANRQDMSGLLAWLAFTPWRGWKEWSRYHRLRRAGKVPFSGWISWEVWAMHEAAVRTKSTQGLTDEEAAAWREFITRMAAGALEGREEGEASGQP